MTDKHDQGRLWPIERVCDEHAHGCGYEGGYRPRSCHDVKQQGVQHGHASQCCGICTPPADFAQWKSLHVLEKEDFGGAGRDRDRSAEDERMSVTACGQR